MKKRTRNEKYICCICCIMGIVSGLFGGESLFAFAEDTFPRTRFWGDYITPDTSDGAISLDILLEWDKTYSENPEKDKQQLPQVTNEIALNIAWEFSEKAVPILTTISATDDKKYLASYLAVFDENGEYVFRLTNGAPEGSANTPGPYLIGNFSGSFINLRLAEHTELQKFVESEYTLRENFQKKYLYLKDNLSLDEYGGHDYIHNVSESDFNVWLVNEERREELENLGYVCKKADYSLEEYYEDVEFLWENREQLGIFDVTYGYINDEIRVSGVLANADFDKKAEELGLDAPYSYTQTLWTSTGGTETEYLNPIIHEKWERYIQNDLEDVAQFVELLEYMKTSEWGSNYEYKNGSFEHLKSSLKTLKEAYPSYSCANLYYHVAGDCDAEKYLNFDTDLLEFVDTLPNYVSDKNLFEEAQFGDPQRLELKRMLRQYKEIYPDMSYEKIYATYIKDIEENNNISKEEKLYQYLWFKYSTEADETIKNPTEHQGEKHQKEAYLVLATGTILMLVAGLLTKVTHKKRKI